MQLFGVFDGHGSKGEVISQFIKAELEPILSNEASLEIDPV